MKYVILFIGIVSYGRLLLSTSPVSQSGSGCCDLGLYLAGGCVVLKENKSCLSPIEVFVLLRIDYCDARPFCSAHIKL